MNAELSAEYVPPFRMPVCFKHFFGSHRWWCRKCDQETARQFKEVYEAFWRSDRRYNELADRIDGTGSGNVDR